MARFEKILSDIIDKHDISIQAIREAYKLGIKTGVECKELIMDGYVVDLETGEVLGREITEKQQKVIDIIESNTDYEFEGRTKEEAIEFISKHIEESKGCCSPNITFKVKRRSNNNRRTMYSNFDSLEDHFESVRIKHGISVPSNLMVEFTDEEMDYIYDR